MNWLTRLGMLGTHRQRMSFGPNVSAVSKLSDYLLPNAKRFERGNMPRPAQGSDCGMHHVDLFRGFRAFRGRTDF